LSVQKKRDDFLFFLFKLQLSQLSFYQHADVKRNIGKMAAKYRPQTRHHILPKRDTEMLKEMTELYWIQGWFIR
jgi:hypothetical protein